MPIRDLTGGCEVDLVAVVRAAAAGTLTLGDDTGEVAAAVAPGVAAQPGDAVRVRGRFVADPPVIEVAELHPAGAPPRSAEQMEADLRELVATIQDPHVRVLLDRLLGEDTATWEHYRRAPAAKHYHQAYRHGLLEHSLTVAQAVSAISATFPGIDRDVAVAGALLHDIGKLEAYTAADEGAIEMTDAGKLQGEIPLGYFRVRREIEEIDGFSPRVAEAILHIILSHHGALAHGSPVVPCTREATLVHMIDNLGGRLGSFDRLEKELEPGAAWSGYDRALGSGAYFGAARAVAEDRAAA